MKSFLLSVFLLLTTLTTAAQPTDLLISEYIEGSSFNKAIELYNGTGAAVDLSAYTLELYSNGSAVPSQSTGLSGTLANGDVHVLAHASAAHPLIDAADATSSSVINFNGDDTVVLRKGGAVVDAFGQVGFDPGSSWDSGSTSTANNNLRRRAGDCTADTNADDAFDPAAHYEGFGNDVFDGFGSHTSTCSGGGGGNAAPQFTAELTDQIVPADVPFTFTYEASDSDLEDVLTFSLDEGPATATLDPVSGDFEWTPAASDAGQAFTVTVSVSDGDASDVTGAVLTVASDETSSGDLIFSEYVEGSGFNKALELYNSTSSAIDLSAYAVELYSNGSTSAGSSVSLSGVVAAGDVYVMAHPSADPAIQAVTDLTDGSVVNFNGDDAIVLRKNGAVADAIGQVGVDPGSQWGSSAASTADNTLRRLASDCTGDVNAADPFDPAVRYEGFAQDTFDGLGAHTATCTGDGGGGDDDNAAPLFTNALADTVLGGGAALEFVFSATDADGDHLTYDLVEGPTGASIDASGAFSWTAGDPGIYTITASVSDGTATTTTTAYAGVHGTLFPDESGATLRASIRAEFTPDQTLGYDVARDTLYLRIDRDPDGMIRGVYTGFAVELPDGVDPSAYLAANGINAEHTWPQSMGADDEPGRSDMHNLFPSKDNVNSARSNKPYADIPDDQTEIWYRLDESQTTIPTASIDLYSESAAGYFEPRELHKGNAARAGLYFFTIYEAVSNSSFLLEQRDTFIDWNALDAVDGAEVGRSGQIAERQGNVNPFLIDPTLAARAVSDITPPPVIAIADARTEPDGALVSIEGIVTRAGGRFTRLQDETAGLTTFQSTGALRAAVESGAVAKGDLLRVTGAMDTFNGLRQLSPSLFEVVSRGNELPEPQLVTLAEIAANGEMYESELIRVVGLQIDSAGDDVFQAAMSYSISDASDATGVVSLRTPSGGEGDIIGTPIPSSHFTFVGVLGEFRGEYQLQPIDAGDVEADAVPPVITLVDGPATLWPPNHNYHAFAIDELVVEVIDDAQGALPVASVVIDRVTSDEPENGAGDGNTTDDIVIGEDCRSVEMRAERQDDGDGRVYTIHLAAADASGNVGTAAYEVHVPASKDSAAAAGEAAYTVEAGCALIAASEGQSAAVDAARKSAGADAETLSAVGAAFENEPSDEVPMEFALSPAFPNPFNPQANFTMTVDADQQVRIEVFDIVGRRVSVLHDGTLSAGRIHQFTFNAGSMPSGTYVLRAIGKDEIQQQILTLVK